jgi:hypothetical protein
VSQATRQFARCANNGVLCGDFFVVEGSRRTDLVPGDFHFTAPYNEETETIDFSKIRREQINMKKRVIKRRLLNTMYTIILFFGIILIFGRFSFLIDLEGRIEIIAARGRVHQERPWPSRMRPCGCIHVIHSLGPTEAFYTTSFCPTTLFYFGLQSDSATIATVQLKARGSRSGCGMGGRQ